MSLTGVSLLGVANWPVVINRIIDLLFTHGSYANISHFPLLSAHFE